MLRCSSLRLGTAMTAILANKNPSAASVFRPSALLREARRQKGLAAVDVPSICILDPDGDIVRQLRRTGAARPFEGWPCYHTTLDTFVLAEQTVGIVDRALRDEGTSYHYAAPSDYSEADARLVATALAALEAKGLHAIAGSSWTTDAPFRETTEAIEAAQSKGVLAVEMEAAALYAFAKSTGARVLCLAHVTNTMGRMGEDFEKGEADGTRDALQILETIVRSIEV